MTIEYVSFAWRQRTWLLVSALCLQSCAVGKDYQIPSTDITNVWNILSQNEALAPIPPVKVTSDKNMDIAWWALFRDETLTRLVEKSLVANNDLKATQARILEARANERLEHSSFFPQLEAAGSLRRQTLGSSFGDKLDTTKQGTVNGDWNIDLFGGTQRRSEAAAYATDEAIAHEEQTRLTLIADVARNYVRLRGLQQQYAVTQKNIGLQDDTLKITRGQRREEMVSQLDVARARAQLNGTRARLPLIRADIYAAINRLAVLTDMPIHEASELLSFPAAIPAVPIEVVTASPVDTIMRRPDVKVAERRLAQATALHGAAFAEFFPKLSLSGFFGRAGSDLFGSTNPWSAAANGLFPLLNFGRIQSQVDVADARQQQAFHQFRQQVLLAVEDVEVSFSAFINEADRYASLKEVAKDQDEAVTIAREQYKVGMAPQLDLLVAERNVLDAENDLITSETSTALNLIRLYNALGQGNAPSSPGTVGDTDFISLP